MSGAGSQPVSYVRVILLLLQGYVRTHCTCLMIKERQVQEHSSDHKASQQNSRIQ